MRAGTEKKAVQFARDELALIDVWATDPDDEREWANELCEHMRDCAQAPDYEGATRDVKNGINVLIYKEHFQWWAEAAEMVGGLEIELVEGRIENRRYGDGMWNGVEIVSAEEDGDEVYWIEL